ncbi:MAG TPA: tetratricopeptide repeat protein, partial [Methyloceanibacter sp.]|nr:tetratricopeptide repeat protein [Methyloceanibacter sp.]
TNFYAFWNRGAVHAAKGEIDRAQEDFTTALALNPDKTSKAKIEEALNVVLAAAKAAHTEVSDPSVITDPSRFWGPQQGLAGSAASSFPADAAMPAARPMELQPAIPAAPSMGPAVVPPDR